MGQLLGECYPLESDFLNGKQFEVLSRLDQSMDCFRKLAAILSDMDI